MKKIFLVIIGVFIAGGLLYYFQYKSRAQTAQIMLAKITYTNDAEFETAFDGSTSVHYYYEQPSGTNSYMISKLTTDQYTKLTSRGFTVEKLETNPDMSSYLIVYTPQVVQVDSFAVIGDAKALDTHFTLVKTGSSVQKFGHDALVDDDVAIFTYDIAKPLAKPLYKTVRVKNQYR